uniref:Uncharacterized protein n=1 Tax=Amphimedon queenslandica TaxID=400682 RepID=A0A1X7VAS2_AMPQE
IQQVHIGCYVKKLLGWIDLCIQSMCVNCEGTFTLRP